MEHPSKNQIRAHFLAERDRHHSDSDKIQRANAALCEQVNRFFHSRASGLWAYYRPMPGEASIAAALPVLEKRGMRFCYPRVVDMERGTMDFFLAESESDFEPHPWGMLEPKATCQIVRPEEIVGVFTPLLAFDAYGTRLGKGKAFYDRYLANFGGKKIGLAFEWQYSIWEIPREPHDVHLHAAITDQKVHRFILERDGKE